MKLRRDLLGCGATLNLCRRGIGGRPGGKTEQWLPQRFEERLFAVSLGQFFNGKSSSLYCCRIHSLWLFFRQQ